METVASGIDDPAACRLEGPGQSLSLGRASAPGGAESVALVRGFQLLSTGVQRVQSSCLRVFCVSPHTFHTVPRVHFGGSIRVPFSGPRTEATKVRPNCWASPLWSRNLAWDPVPKRGPRTFRISTPTSRPRPGGFHRQDPPSPSPKVHRSVVRGELWKGAR